MVRFVSIESNWKNIKDELATRNVLVLNFYDIALDFILLDAFEDLEDPVIFSFRFRHFEHFYLLILFMNNFSLLRSLRKLTLIFFFNV